jgi:CDP-glucose 4,6-dehydratase
MGERSCTLEGLVVNPGFWTDRRVFLTGHTGFKGSWLALWLGTLGARVTGYSLQPPTRPSLYEMARVSCDLESVVADVRDGGRLAASLSATRPEVVIHLAAQPLVRRSYLDPTETFSTNVMGTVNLLEAVRRVDGIRAVVIVTTDKCYMNREQRHGYLEGDALGGHDPYSASKACTELVAGSYRASFFPIGTHASHGVAIATARAGNVIGGGDYGEDRLVPDLLAAFEAGVPAAIRHPGAIRPWQHVLAPLLGYLDLAEGLYRDGPRFADAWNFGPDDQDARDVGWIADTLVGMWGPGAAWHTPDGPHPHETATLRLDSSRARAELGWRPAIPLLDSLRRVVDWAHARRAGQDMRRFTLAQIASFQLSSTQ